MATKQVSEKGLNWFQDARFGMFIHWGLYSLLARGEWVMHYEKIPVMEYETLASQFNPIEFSAEEWVALAADAGQKYIVITSRHHDGFSMYDTQWSDYKITNTSFKRDPLLELAEACTQRRDIKLGFYVSLLDWHHPAYRFREESELAWSDYIEFLHGQVRELCTQYGELACLWFDGDWPRQTFEGDSAYFTPGGPFQYEGMYNMVHKLQPDAVIQNNRHAEPLPGEDIQGFEQDLPGTNTAGFNTTSVYSLPLEVCMTINDNWGIHHSDENHKSIRHLIHTLVRSASVGANLLLNVGPTALGEIIPIHNQRLRGMGAWLREFGESVYGTRAGLIPPTRQSVCTSRGRNHYVHVLDYISDYVKLKDIPMDLSRARLLHNDDPVKMTWSGDELILTLPEEHHIPTDTVVVLE
jgi:alpha-L-fucosidase